MIFLLDYGIIHSLWMLSRFDFSSVRSVSHEICGSGWAVSTVMSWWLQCCVNTSKYEANKAFNPGAGQSGEWWLVSHDWRPHWDSEQMKLFLSKCLWLNITWYTTTCWSSCFEIQTECLQEYACLHGSTYALVISTMITFVTEKEQMSVCCYTGCQIIHI